MARQCHSLPLGWLFFFFPFFAPSLKPLPGSMAETKPDVSEEGVLKISLAHGGSEPVTVVSFFSTDRFLLLRSAC